MFVRLLIVVLLFPVSGGSSASAKTAPSCMGFTATQHLIEPGTLTFTAGNDVLVGSDGDDLFIVGLDDWGGIDIVCGNGGNDEIHSNSSPGSMIFGDEGADTIWAQSGTTARGGPGNDRLIGYGAGTVLHGDEGADRVDIYLHAAGYGGPDDDDMRANNGGLAFGEAGNDVIATRNGSIAHGGAGDDTLTIAFGGGIAHGGAGDDLIQVELLQPSYLHEITCGSGVDLVEISASTLPESAFAAEDIGIRAAPAPFVADDCEALTQ